MDGEFSAAAATASATLVALFATDAWTQAKTLLERMWRKVRPEAAEAIEADLVQLRSDVVAARQDGDGQKELSLVDLWRDRLLELLTLDPTAVTELRQMVSAGEHASSSEAGTQQNSARFSATASGQARIYQAGRDQTITEQ
jgi:hypothetical protein